MLGSLFFMTSHDVLGGSQNFSFQNVWCAAFHRSAIFLSFLVSCCSRDFRSGPASVNFLWMRRRGLWMACNEICGHPYVHSCSLKSSLRVHKIFSPFAMIWHVLTVISRLYCGKSLRYFRFLSVSLSDGYDAHVIPLSTHHIIHNIADFFFFFLEHHKL